ILLGLPRKSFNTEDTDTNGVSRKALQAGRDPPFSSVISVLGLLRALARKRREAGCVASGHGGARRIEHHSQQGVVAGDADDIDHALLAERGHRPRVGGVADALIAM